MKDIVYEMQRIAEGLNLEYYYGKKAALNILDADIEDGKTYLLHEFTNQTPEYSNDGTKIISQSFSGKFFLTSKENIDQLTTQHIRVGSALQDFGAEVQEWESIDVTPALEYNGLLCSYTVKFNR